jgi:hypothetical protein
MPSALITACLGTWGKKRNIKMKKRLIFLAVALSLMFTGCSKDDDPDLISLKESEKTLYYGDEYQIEATSKAAITYTVEMNTMRKYRKPTCYGKICR